MANNDCSILKSKNNLRRKKYSLENGVKKDDLIILFNRLLPMEIETIKNHQNKIMFLRNFSWWLRTQSDGENFHRGKIFEENHIFFKQIILISGDNQIYQLHDPNNDVGDYFSKINFDTSKLIDISKDINPLLSNFETDSILTTGFIAYLYIKNYLYQTGDEIILVGFDGKVNFSKHDTNFEHQYYQSEIKNLVNLKCIEYL